MIRESGRGMDMGGMPEKSGDQKPKIKVIKKNTEGPLNIPIENIRRVPPEEDFEEATSKVDEASKPVERQSDGAWAEDFRAQVRLKQTEKMTDKEKARDEFKRLFGDKE